MRGGRDAREFARVAAGELAADDVGMGGEGDDGVGVEVGARHGGGVIVDEERQGRGGGDVEEELVQGRGREEGLVVGGRQHEGVVAARDGGVVAERDRLPRRLGAATDDDGHSAEAGVVERLPRHTRDGLALARREVHGFAVGALRGEACDAGAGEPDRVRGDGRPVELFRAGGEEAQRGDVDAGPEGPVRLLLRLHVVDAGRGGAVDRVAVARVRVHGLHRGGAERRGVVGGEVVV